MYYNTAMDIKEQLRLIPESSGSYQFFDEENNNPKMIQNINAGLKSLTDEQLSIIATLVENFNKEK